MEAVFLRILNMSITAGWLVLAVLLLRLVLKRAPKAIRCALWSLVAIRFLTGFVRKHSFAAFGCYRIVLGALNFAGEYNGRKLRAA